MVAPSQPWTTLVRLPYKSIPESSRKTVRARYMWMSFHQTNLSYWLSKQVFIVTLDTQHLYILFQFIMS